MDRPITPGSAAAASSLTQDTLVAEVYRSYAAFYALAAGMQRADLAHRLVLCQPLSVAGEAPMIAASIASAASLAIEPDPAAVRKSIRSGAVDFTVNSLDEALRALKNEIRKGLSIAVCLEGDPAIVLAQMAERGVQPDFLCSSADQPVALQPFLDRGASIIDFSAALLPRELIDTTWRVSKLPGKWLPRLDEMVAATLLSEDHLRRQWLQRAPRYLGRALRMERFLPLREEEWQQLRASLTASLKAEPWDTVVTLQRGVDAGTYGATSATPAGLPTTL